MRAKKFRNLFYKEFARISKRYRRRSLISLQKLMLAGVLIWLCKPPMLEAHDLAALKGSILTTTSGESFEVLGLLGKGGMGIVYHAKSLRTGSELAIKLVRGSDVQGTAGFLKSYHLVATTLKETPKEAAPLIPISHVGIYTVSTGERTGDSYAGYAMTIRRSLNLLEAVSAFTLRVKDSTAERLERRVQRLHALMLQMIEVLNYTSSQGIVMNDVKPQNIFIVDLSNGNAAQMSASTIVTGQARIMLSDYDFVTKRGEPSSGGTVGFTALERFKQKDLPGTPRSTELSDLYSFGASLYALMHGQEAIIEINGGSMSSNPLERKEALGVVFPKLAVYLRKRLAEYRQLVSSLSPETKKQFEEVADFIYGAMHIYDGDRVIYLNRQLSDYIVINEYTRRIESRAGRACEKVYAARPAGFPN